MLSFGDVAWICVSIAIGYWILELFRRRRLSANGKAVLITGCDSGFGYLLAQRMARLGYKVLAGCLLIDEKGAEELKSLPNIKVFHLDVREDQSVENAAKIVSDELPGNELWAVVNNAGIGHVSEMEWTPLQTIMDVCDVNAFGMVRVTKQLLPFLKKSKGRIVNVTSMIAELSDWCPGLVGYGMSKAAASIFNDVIRVELKKWGIKVINIAPYAYSTMLNNRDRLMQQFRNAWIGSDPETRADLGEEYFEKYVTFHMQLIVRTKNSNPNKVVDCMEDAITSASPKLCYRPGDIFSKLGATVLVCLPTSLQDYIKTLVFVIPKP